MVFNLFLARGFRKRPTKDLAAHLEGAHGTLICRGTPVEKHWVKGLKVCMNHIKKLLPRDCFKILFVKIKSYQFI